MLTVTLFLSLLIATSVSPFKLKDGVGAVPRDVKTLFKNVFDALPATLATGLPDEGIPSLSPYTQDITGISVDGEYHGTLTFDLTDVVMNGFSNARQESYYIYQSIVEKDSYEVDRVIYSVAYLNATYSAAGSYNTHTTSATGTFSISASYETRTSDMVFRATTDDSGNVTYSGVSDDEFCTLNEPVFTITGLPTKLTSLFQLYYNSVIRDLYCGAIGAYVTNDIGEMAVIVDMLNSGDYN